MNLREFGIAPDRELSAAERGRVRSRFIRASMRPAHVPEPLLSGIRWADDYRHVFVPAEDTGLLACGFESLFPEHAPVASDVSGFVFTYQNPGARSLLGAVAATLTGSPLAAVEIE